MFKVRITPASGNVTKNRKKVAIQAYIEVLEAPEAFKPHSHINHLISEFWLRAGHLSKLYIYNYVVCWNNTFFLYKKQTQMISPPISRSDLEVYLEEEGVVEWDMNELELTINPHVERVMFPTYLLPTYVNKYKMKDAKKDARIIY